MSNQSLEHDSNGDVPARFKILSHYMDEAFTLPGGKKVGWDGIIGLVPGIGDIAGTVISSYMILFAIRQGVSKVVVLRMLYNVCIEAVIGFIPVVGDIFDFFFKSNTRNYDLLQKHIRDPSGARAATLGWIILFAAIIVIIWASLIWAFISLLQVVFSLF